MTKIFLLVSTFVSALLLFSVQPLYTKYLLPYFGGTSAVWTISVFFYSTTLLVGYLYASLLTSWSIKQARLVHLSLLALVALLMSIRWVSEGSPLLVDSVSHSFPSLSVLLTLAMGVGLPVLLLASTSVITQYLFAKVTNEEPYHLFALSNAGSLLALLLYPFVVERYVGLSLQSLLWFYGFIAFLIFIGAAWLRVENKTEEIVLSTKKKLLDKKVEIILLAAIPTFLLASITELFSRGIASFPLLWILPLAIYLTTFIVAFSGKRKKERKVSLGFWSLLTIIPVFALLPSMNLFAGIYWLSLFVTLISFYVISLHFHSEAYKLRPSSDNLGNFYVFVTLGGAIGSGVVGIILPLIMNSQTEVFYAFAILAIYFSYHHLRWLEKKFTSFLMYLAQFLVLVIALFFIYSTTYYLNKVTSHRNFYGTLTVVDSSTMVHGESVETRMIVNGVTNHGLQVLESDYEYKTASYYGPNSGVDVAIRSFTDNQKNPRVAVVGLGAGMMSAYCDDAESIDFIEINPAVEMIARKYFTYLDGCKDKIKVEIGDGRLVLEQMIREDSRAQFDVLMMDAFTDDAIPAHLLTVEAFNNAYRPLLSEDGVLAFHISNKYLNLSLPIAGMVKESGYETVKVKNIPDGDDGLQYPTMWILVMKAEKADYLVRSYKNAEYYRDDFVVWTDERSSVMDALSLGGSQMTIE